jgi:hypothetical protein
LPPVGSDGDATGTVSGKGGEMLRRGAKSKDPETRDAYLELMRHWRELADEIERFEHAWLDREGI